MESVIPEVVISGDDDSQMKQVKFEEIMRQRKIRSELQKILTQKPQKPIGNLNKDELKALSELKRD